MSKNIDQMISIFENHFNSSLDSRKIINSFCQGVALFLYEQAEIRHQLLGFDVSSTRIQESVPSFLNNPRYFGLNIEMRRHMNKIYCSEIERQIQTCLNNAEISEYSHNELLHFMNEKCIDAADQISIQELQSLENVIDRFSQKQQPCDRQLYAIYCMLVMSQENSMIAPVMNFLLTMIDSIAVVQPNSLYLEASIIESMLIYIHQEDWLNSVPVNFEAILEDYVTSDRCVFKHFDVPEQKKIRNILKEYYQNQRKDSHELLEEDGHTSSSCHSPKSEGSHDAHKKHHNHAAHQKHGHRHQDSLKHEHSHSSLGSGCTDHSTEHDNQLCLQKEFSDRLRQQEYCSSIAFVAGRRRRQIGNIANKRSTQIEFKGEPQIDTEMRKRRGRKKENANVSDFLSKVRVSLWNGFSKLYDVLVHFLSLFFNQSSFQKQESVTVAPAQGGDLLSNAAEAQEGQEKLKVSPVAVQSGSEYLENSLKMSK